MKKNNKLRKRIEDIIFDVTCTACTAGGERYSGEGRKEAVDDLILAVNEVVEDREIELIEDVLKSVTFFKKADYHYAIYMVIPQTYINKLEGRLKELKDE